MQHHRHKQICAPAAAGRLIQDRSRKSVYRWHTRVDEGRDSRSVTLSPPYTAEKELDQQRNLVELRM